MSRIFINWVRVEFVNNHLINPFLLRWLSCIAYVASAWFHCHRMTSGWVCDQAAGKVAALRFNTQRPSEGWERDTRRHCLPTICLIKMAQVGERVPGRILWERVSKWLSLWHTPRSIIPGGRLCAFQSTLVYCCADQEIFLLLSCHVCNK